ncbi:MATE family efflux transporter [Cohnella hongkongensis]|uniref:MATE family efflux transporter n=1 Tax=Cohnella hongkongensis TaxID=178337 RepID=A0ABV9FE87_9BACL
MPFLIGNALQSLNGLVNSIWVGQLLGEQALAATSGANTLLFFLIMNCSSVRTSPNFKFIIS